MMLFIACVMQAALASPVAIAVRSMDSHAPAASNTVCTAAGPSKQFGSGAVTFASGGGRPELPGEASPFLSCRYTFTANSGQLAELTLTSETATSIDANYVSIYDGDSGAAVAPSLGGGVHVSSGAFAVYSQACGVHFLPLRPQGASSTKRPGRGCRCQALVCLCQSFP